MTELQKDVTEALAIDKPVDAQVASAIGEPVTPTEPAAPTPQTVVEAEAHRAANEPLAIVSEVQPAPQAPADAPKEAKAS